MPTGKQMVPFYVAKNCHELRLNLLFFRKPTLKSCDGGPLAGKSVVEVNGI